MTRDTLDVENCVPTMKVFRFVEGKVVIACGPTVVGHGFSEDSNVKISHVRWYRTVCGGSSSYLECYLLLPKMKGCRMPRSVSAAWSSELESFSFRSWQR